ncbi:hypothetical protein GCM10009785_31300 [Brooklawnia cerclae]|uniref:DUF5808 domain-containing protein n=1 Tax=Brooklawnia cerclae TaxID=349934 RepID=A0ABX0SHP3_9ACTN|nr:DUF5808 domain-containing protein [Brooklawnia cerclae]NIH56580.1 hypothetical protein [Brooklawnia cerclae]
MTTTPIDDYVREVGRHLRLRGRKRAQALADLREALAEAATATSVGSAVTDAGPALDYAANLDEQFGTADGAFHRVLGLPNSFGPGIGKRLASTFDPTDERLVIPRVFGAGWTLNMGAVAVRLGLLRPDDADDEILASAADDHLVPSRVLALVPLATALAAVAFLHARRDVLIKQTGKPQTANLVLGTLMPLGAAALVAASADDSLAPAQRLTMPAVGASLATIAAGTSAQLATKPKGQAVMLASIGLAGTIQLLLSYLPVRAALTERWRNAAS